MNFFAQAASKLQLEQNSGHVMNLKRKNTMQAEAALLLEPGKSNNDSTKITTDSINIASTAIENNLVAKKDKPIKIDFSAYCDCV